MNKLCIISFIAINEYSLAFKGFHIFVIPVLCPDLLLLLLRFRVGYVANTISNWIGTNCKMCKKICLAHLASLEYLFTRKCYIELKGTVSREFFLN